MGGRVLCIIQRGAGLVCGSLSLSLSFFFLWMDCLHSNILAFIPRCKRSSAGGGRTRWSVWLLGLSFGKRAIALTRGDKLTTAASLPQNAPIAKVNWGRRQQSVDVSTSNDSDEKNTCRIHQHVLFLSTISRACVLKGPARPCRSEAWFQQVPRDTEAAMIIWISRTHLCFNAKAHRSVKHLSIP